MYLVVVDAYSKWPEVMVMNQITSMSTIAQFKWLFNRYGLPKLLVTDNGTQYTSQEFTKFCQSNGIKHKFSAPYCPMSNGQAERFVDILKRQLKKCAKVDRDWLNSSLFAYRSTPSQVLGGRSPAELFLGRKIRTKLSLLKPDQPVEKSQSNKYTENMAKQFNTKHGVKARSFKTGDSVIFLNYQRGNSGKPTWIQGVVTECNGVIYKIHSHILRAIVRRHANQIRYFTTPDEQTVPEQPASQASPRFNPHHSRTPSPAAPVVTQQSPPVQARPQRNRRPPLRLEMDSSKQKYETVPHH